MILDVNRNVFLPAYKRNLSVVFAFILTGLDTRVMITWDWVCFLFPDRDWFNPLFETKEAYLSFFVCQPGRICFFFSFSHLIAIQVSVHNFLCPAFVCGPCLNFRCRIFFFSMTQLQPLPTFPLTHCSPCASFSAAC